MSLSERFWDETAKGIANVLVNVETAWHGPDANDYAEERRRLEKYPMAWKYGLASTAFLFLNFRIAGSKSFIRWRENLKRARGWNSNSAKIGSVSQGSPKQQQIDLGMGHLERKRQKEIKEALASMQVVTDLLVSISVGVSGTMYLLHAEKDAMREDFETAPLVSGRSVVADEMCANMVSIADSFPPQSTKDDSNLETFVTFVKNCRKRGKFEQDFRLLSGKSDHEPVVIPDNAF